MTCRPGLLLASMLVLAACASGGAPVRAADVSPPPYAGSRIPGTTEQPAQGPFRPNAFLRACPGMRVSNAPPLDPERWILRYNPLIVVYGIVMASAPVNDVCLSSGKGLRDGRPHEGIDLAGRPPGRVYSAAPGRVAEARNSSGYGLNVVIDHGRGVFTRTLTVSRPVSGLVPCLALASRLARWGQPGMHRRRTFTSKSSPVTLQAHPDRSAFGRMILSVFLPIPFPLPETAA